MKIYRNSDLLPQTEHAHLDQMLEIFQTEDIGLHRLVWAVENDISTLTDMLLEMDKAPDLAQLQEMAEGIAESAKFLAHIAMAGRQ